MCSTYRIDFPFGLCSFNVFERKSCSPFYIYPLCKANAFVHQRFTSLELGRSAPLKRPANNCGHPTNLSGRRLGEPTVNKKGVVAVPAITSFGFCHKYNRERLGTERRIHR